MFTLFVENLSSLARLASSVHAIPSASGDRSTLMNKALSRNPTGLDDATRVAVRRAAQQAGKSLGDWIDEAIRLQAEAATGVDRKTGQTKSQASAPQTVTPPGLEARVAEISRRLRENRGVSASAPAPEIKLRRAGARSPQATAADDTSEKVLRGRDDLRREIAELARAMSALTPRDAAGEINRLLNLLEDRIAGQRDAGVPEYLLAPAEHIAAQLRHAAMNLDPAQAINDFRSELYDMARRLEVFCGPDSASSLAMSDLSRQLSALKEQVSRLSDEAPQFEKYETSLLELLRHVCALTESGALAQSRHAREMEMLSHSITALLKAETDRGVDACRRQMKACIADFDAALDRAGEKNLAEMDARLRLLGESLSKSLSQKIDDGVACSRAETSALQDLTQTLAQKIDAALTSPSTDLQVANPQVADLVGRLDAMHAALTRSVDQGNAARQADLAQHIEKLAARIDQALESQNDDEPLKALEGQIGKLAARLDATHNETIKLAERIARQAGETAAQSALDKETGVNNAASLAQEQKETRETLRAVQEWLTRIGDRFASVENAVRQLQTSSAQVTHLAAPPEVVNIPPRLDASSSPSTAGATLRESFVAIKDVEARATQAGFIAAARRAAQQATSEPWEQDGVKAERATPVRDRQKLIPAVLAHKRMALVLVGACILIAGAYQLTQNVAPNDAGLMTASRQTPPSEPKGALQTAIVARPSSSQQSVDPPGSAQHMAGAASSVDPAPVGAIGAPGPSSAAASINSAMALATLAANGDAPAQFELASRYADGREIARDARLAVLWFEMAAQQGLAPAQYRLGTLYEKGIGVERNETVAHDWYRRAAEAGNVRAMHNLAVMLAEGAGGKPDYAAAAVWFRKAADLGVRDSQYNLAILYARGLGVETSLVQSYLWFSAAATQGDADAAKKRDEVAARLGGRDLETAKALAAGFQAKTPTPAANDVVAPSGGWRTPAPASKASGKPKVSWFQSFWGAAKEGAAQSDFQTRL